LSTSTAFVRSEKKKLKEGKRRERERESVCVCVIFERTKRRPSFKTTCGTVFVNKKFGILTSVTTTRRPICIGTWAGGSATSTSRCVDALGPAAVLGSAENLSSTDYYLEQAERVWADLPPLGFLHTLYIL
jgi:hypothetical protein